MTAVRLRPSRIERRCSCGTVLATDNAGHSCYRCQRAFQQHSLAPPAVSEEFWTHPSMVRAFAEQNMGALLEAYRCHPAHTQRISQERLADWLGVSQAQLSRYEHGRKPIDRLDRLRYFATALGIPECHLWFSLTNRDGTGQEATESPSVLSTSWDPMDTARSVEETTRSDLVLSRRAALTGATAVVVGSALIEPMQNWLIPLTRKAGQLAGSAVSEEELSGLRTVVAGMRDWSRRSGDGLARKAVIGQLNELADRLREAPDTPATRQAFFLGAELAKIAASMSWDAGLHDSAQRYYVLAVRMAKTSGNVAFGALCLASMARQMFDLNRPSDGLDLVRLAQYGARREPSPTLRAVLYTREAWAYALMGQTQEFHRAIGQAQESFSAYAAGGEPAWLSSFDEAELEGIIGARMRDLAKYDPGQARTAEQHISRALALRDPSRVRNRMFDLIGLARTRLTTNEPEAACTLIQSVLPTIEHVGSGRVGRKLRDFLTESATYQELPTIRETRSAIRAARIA